MNILSVFNNKGGVGKTTLTYHLSYALSELGYKVLLIDLDPQSNLTLYGCSVEYLHEIWEEEDPYIDEGFDLSRNKVTKEEYNQLIQKTRTIHFLLKPTEEGTSDIETNPPPIEINSKLYLIPGRLTLHTYENRISSRWNDTYSGDPLAIRTITKIRSIATSYAEEYGFDFVIIDTSPSLGSLNRVVISTVDGFLIPALPDMFSLYGIRNIGNALTSWKQNFETIYKLISDEKRKLFPEKFVRFLGYTIYNAKKYSRGGVEWDLAQAHFNYATQIPATITKYISEDIRNHLTSEMIKDPIGMTAVMHTHNTLPSMAQKYRLPFWMVPGIELESEDRAAVMGYNKDSYLKSKDGYKEFALDLLKRVETL